MTSLVAHAGAGSSWQAMIVVSGVVLAGFLVAAAVGRVRLERPDDLVLPLAATAVASSLGALADQWLSDGVGWGLPLAAVSLVALLLAAFTDLDVRLPAPLPMGAGALAVVSAIALAQPLTVALHPDADLLPLSDDAQVVIAEPAEGDTVEAGSVTVVVETPGGSLGPGLVALEDLGDDPEEAGVLSVVIEQVGDDGSATERRILEPSYDRSCTLTEPCDRVAFSASVDPGTHRLTVELMRGDGTPLAPFVRDRNTFTAR